MNSCHVRVSIDPPCQRVHAALLSAGSIQYQYPGVILHQQAYVEGSQGMFDLQTIYSMQLYIYSKQPYVRPMKLHYQLLVLLFLYFHASGRSLLIHCSEYFVTWRCGFLELIGTTKIINKKEAWLAFQGNNEGRCSRLKQTRAGTRN